MSLLPAFSLNDSCQTAPRVNKLLAEDQRSKIFIRGQQNCICWPAVAENGFIVDPGSEFSNKPNVVSASAEPIDNLLVDALVRYYFSTRHFSTGCTTSARSTSAANAIAARMPSAVSRGCSDKI